MKPLLALVGFLLLAYLVTAFSETLLCYSSLKADTFSRFRTNGELWEECRNDHLLFPLKFF